MVRFARELLGLRLLRVGSQPTRGRRGRVWSSRCPNWGHSTRELVQFDESKGGDTVTVEQLAKAYSGATKNEARHGTSPF